MILQDIDYTGLFSFIVPTFGTAPERTPGHLGGQAAAFAGETSENNFGWKYRSLSSVLTSRQAASFASWSACSFMRCPLCAFTHCQVTGWSPARASSVCQRSRFLTGFLADVL